MYRIGFDAKRLFHNGTGLGNYSRSLVSSLDNFFPNNKYILFTPSVSYNEDSYYFTHKFSIVTPPAFSSIAWRSRFILSDLIQNDIDIYHGLSHELPFGIENTTIKSVVTIHDLIYKFFPADFPLIDKAVYDIKWRNACKNSNAIIATSQATKNDIIQHFGIDEQKIHVVYQTCSSIFEKKLSHAQIIKSLQKFNLPPTFLLYVGAIAERKNVLALVEAYNKIKKDIQIPLLIVGNGRGHVTKVKNYIATHNLQSKVILLHNVENSDLPALYQAAKAFIYPSKYEGFGIPIVEALKSGTPIITSNVSCMPEVAENAAVYSNPNDIDSIANAIATVCNNENLRNELISNGYIQSQKFSLQNFATDTMKVYHSL